MVRYAMLVVVAVAAEVAGCADGSELECGEGTHEADGVCVADDDPVGLTCGAGTHVDGTMCVPDAPPSPGRYELRVVTNQIPADGYSKVPVLAIGTNMDGTPATDQVVLNTSRAGAGMFTTPAPTLGPLGASTFYVSCNAATPGCAGPVTLTLAKASAPTVIIADVDVDLVAPMGVGTPAPCMLGGNVMFFDGTDFIFNGTMTVTNATWSGTASAKHLAHNVNPSGPGQGSNWRLELDSSSLPIDLGPGVYEMAQRYPFQQPDHPGLSISGDGRGCNTLTGRFQIHELVRDASGLVRSLATFEQHCEGGANALRGCIRYARP